MLQITPNHKLFVATQAIDFRCGINRLVAACKQQFQLDPRSGHFFIFRNRCCNALKILVFDSQGYWLCHKRLLRGKFNHWPGGSALICRITSAEFPTLIYNGHCLPDD